MANRQEAPTGGPVKQTGAPGANRVPSPDRWSLRGRMPPERPRAGASRRRRHGAAERVARDEHRCRRHLGAGEESRNRRAVLETVLIAADEGAGDRHRSTGAQARDEEGAGSPRTHRRYRPACRDLHATRLDEHGAARSAAGMAVCTQGSTDRCRAVGEALELPAGSFAAEVDALQEEIAACPHGDEARTRVATSRGDQGSRLDHVASGLDVDGAALAIRPAPTQVDGRIQMHVTVREQVDAAARAGALLGTAARGATPDPATEGNRTQPALDVDRGALPEPAGGRHVDPRATRGPDAVLGGQREPETGISAREVDRGIEEDRPPKRVDVHAATESTVAAGGMNSAAGQGHGAEVRADDDVTRLAVASPTRCP